MKNKQPYIAWVLGSFVMGLGMGAGATELVYAPINPSFGGNPNNAPGLLSIAQVQNSMRAPIVVSTNVPLTAVEKFSASLNNLILNRLASETMGTLFGTTSTLSKGEYIAGDFKVVVTEEPLNILKIVTTDKAGNSSEILISKGTL
jgi:curli production assembly/transport component CsgF